MIRGSRNIARSIRRMSTKPVEAPKVIKSTGSTIVERISSFLVGAGVGFGANFYLVHEVYFAFIYSFIFIFFITKYLCYSTICRNWWNQTNDLRKH